MTLLQTDIGRSTADGMAKPANSATIRSARRWKAGLSPIAVMLALLSIATSASGLAISPGGGPHYAGNGGINGVCSATGNACTNAGATVTCTGLTPDQFQFLYYGIRNDQFVNGVKQVGNGGPVAGTDQFKTGTGSIAYTGTTTVWHGGTTAVNSRLVLSVGTVTGGTLSVVSTGGNPADNSSGEIDLLFRVPAGVSGFTMNVKVQAAIGGTPSAGSCPTVFDPSFTRDGTDFDVSHVDLGFYFETLWTPTPTSTPTRTPTPTNTPSSTPSSTPPGCRRSIRPRACRRSPCRQTTPSGC